jgi:hypothetical protein
MNYKSITSSSGGSAPQWKDDQPLQGPQSSTAEAAAPNRTGPSGGAKQWDDCRCDGDKAAPKHHSI